MTQAKIPDLDNDPDLVDNTEVPTRPFKMFGKTWTLRCDMNAFSLSELTTGNPGAAIGFIEAMVVEADDFAAAARKQPNMSPERLGKLIGKLAELAGDRPTTPSSASRTTARKQTSPRK